MTDLPDTEPVPSLPDDWQALTDLVRDRRWRRFMAWSFGISPRLTRHRIHRMLETPGAKAVSALLQCRSAERVKGLRSYAAVNQEQAAAALRMTAIVNVSIPVIFVTLATQLSDGAFWRAVADIYALGDGTLFLIGLIAVTTLLLLVLLGVGAARLGEARDLRHAIDLHAAERGIYFGLEDEETLQPG